jgi:hypothetical protein
MVCVLRNHNNILRNAALDAAQLKFLSPQFRSRRRLMIV